MRFLASVLLAAFALSAAAADDEVAEGRPAPPFTLPVLNPEVAGSDRISLGRYVGDGAEDPGARVVLVSFFASWCEPCKKELPLLVELDRAYREPGLRVLSVAVEEDVAGVEATLRLARKAKARHPVLGDPYGLVSRRYLGARGRLPSVFLVRRDGIVARVERGYAKAASRFLAAEVRAALGLERPRRAPAPP